MLETRQTFVTLDEFVKHTKGAVLPKSWHEMVFVYKGCVIGPPFHLALHKVENFRARPEDVCIMCCPKTGQTLTSALVLMIQNNGDPACLYSGEALKFKVPYLEISFPRNGLWSDPIQPIDHLAQQPGPRIYGTHLSRTALPEQIFNTAKIVYVYRNPKDMIVSNFYFMLSTHHFTGFQGTLSDAVDMVLNDQCLFAPFFDHIESVWKERNRANVFVISYEQLVKNPYDSVKALSHFLGKDLTDSQIESVVRHTRFEEMKGSRTTDVSEFEAFGLIDRNVSPFLRTGKVGDWKNHLTDEMNEKVDAWVARNLASRPGLAGLNFEYE